MKASLAPRGPTSETGIGLGCLAVIGLVGLLLGVGLLIAAISSVSTTPDPRAQFAPFFWGVVFLVVGIAGIGGAIAVLVQSTRYVSVPPNMLGLVSERGQRTANHLLPGKHALPHSTSVYLVSVPESELRRTVKTVGYSRDGAKFTVQAAYTLKPEFEGLWRVVDSGNHVATECDHFVQSVITKRLKQFVDWQEALSGEEELESAVREAVQPETYLAAKSGPFSGFTVTNCNITELLPDGELAGKSLMSLAGERQDFAKDLRLMASKVESLYDLYELRDQLREKYPKRRKDIEDEFERTRIKFKEPR